MNADNRSHIYDSLETYHHDQGRGSGNEKLEWSLFEVQYFNKLSDKLLQGNIVV